MLPFIVPGVEPTKLLGNGVQGRTPQPRPGDDEGSRGAGCPRFLLPFPEKVGGSALRKRSRMVEHDKTIGDTSNQHWVSYNSFAPDWLPTALRHPPIGYLFAILLQ